MATRIYLQSTGTPVSAEASLKTSLEAQNVFWGQVMSYGPNYHIYPIQTTKQSTAMTSLSYTNTSTNGEEWYMMGYAAQLDGAYLFDSTTTVEFSIRAQENNLSANLSLTVDVTVYTPSFTGGSWNNSGAFVSNFWGAGEAGTTLATMWDSATGNGFGGTYTSTSGDWLLVNIAFIKTSTSSFTGTVSLGDDNASDLAAADGGTTALNPWVQFNTNLGFLTPGGGTSTNTNQLMMMGAGT